MAERVGRGALGQSLAVRARRLPPAVWFVLLVAAALVVAVVVAVVGHKSDPLSATVSGVDVQNDPSHFTFTYEVTKNPLSTADCIFQIQDEDHDIITRATEVAPPNNSNQHTLDHTVTVDTSRQGVTAIVQSCQLEKN